MDIIALRGNPNQGKSETLNIVYQLMLLFGYVQGLAGTAHFKVLGNPVQRDFIDILEKKGKRIGVVTIGDYQIGNVSVPFLLKYLDGQGCNKAICACNSNKPRTIKAVMTYPNYLIIDKTITAAVRSIPLSFNT